MRVVVDKETSSWDLMREVKQKNVTIDSPYLIVKDMR